MAEHHPDDLARLTALVQTQQARITRLERRPRLPAAPCPSSSRRFSSR